MGAKINRCRTKNCRGITTRGCHSPYCAKCRTARWVASNPIGAKFKALRNRAKERGHEFTLTLEQFRAFVAQTDYMEKRGRSARCLSIDRKDESRGYHADNLRVCTVSENAARSMEYRMRKAPPKALARYPWRFG